MRGVGIWDQEEKETKQGMVSKSMEGCGTIPQGSSGDKVAHTSQSHPVQGQGSCSINTSMVID